MDQRVSLITLGVADLTEAARFYEALGWRRVEAQEEGIIAFDLLGQVLGLYPLSALAEDMGLELSELGHGAMTLSHNVTERAEVDQIMASALAAGADILRPASEIFWGGYTGYFRAPDGCIWEIAQNPFSKLGPNGAFRWGGF